MLERLFSLFTDSGSKRSAEDGDDPKVAAAALLFHVMDADGERREEERHEKGGIERHGCARACGL